MRKRKSVHDRLWERMYSGDAIIPYVRDIDSWLRLTVHKNLSVQVLTGLPNLIQAQIGDEGKYG